MNRYDAIVIGAGGVGSAAMYHLAQRGISVLGIDRYAPPHDRGSSHGQTRIIRQAYFEHPDYVPLLHRAYQLWQDLESECGETIFQRVGLLEVGPTDGIVIPGVLESAQRHNLQVEKLSAVEVKQRFAGFTVPDSMQAVYEPTAGYLCVERCVQLHLQQATANGATLNCNETVLNWQVENGTVTVKTDIATYHAEWLIIAAGPWSDSLVQQWGVSLRVLRKHLHWFANNDTHYQQQHGCGVFFYETPQGLYYGFPQLDGDGVKVAEHSGGTQIADPSVDDRSIEPQDQQRVAQFMSQYLPGVSSRTTRHAACYYTLTPDEHFIVDSHPQFKQVVLAAGLSGHGFKFSSVLGSIMADLALQGSTPLPIEFLRANRPALLE